MKHTLSIVALASLLATGPGISQTTLEGFEEFRNSQTHREFCTSAFELGDHMIRVQVPSMQDLSDVAASVGFGGLAADVRTAKDRLERFGIILQSGRVFRPETLYVGDVAERSFQTMISSLEEIFPTYRDGILQLRVYASQMRNLNRSFREIYDQAGQHVNSLNCDF